MPLLHRTLPLGFVARCLPTAAPRPPSGAQWLHEIKHDGFRVIARKKGKQVAKPDTASLRLGAAEGLLSEPNSLDFNRPVALMLQYRRAESEARYDEDRRSRAAEQR
jgi:hypothetical protein